MVENVAERDGQKIIAKCDGLEIDFIYPHIRKNEKMTKTQELLEAVRVSQGGATDYKLAKVLEIPRQTVSYYKQGTRQADAYAATRIAIALSKDPLEVIASIEAESASTVAKRAFWKGFPSGLRRTALGLALYLIFGTLGAGWPGGAEAASSSHNVYYVK